MQFFVDLVDDSTIFAVSLFAVSLLLVALFFVSGCSVVVHANKSAILVSIVDIILR